MNFLNNIKVNEVTLSSTIPQYSQRAWTGEELRRSVGIQYYTIKFNLSFEMKDRHEVQAFIAEYQQGKPFNVPLGRAGTYTGSESGAITAAGAVAKGAMIIPTTQNTLRVGDLVQFSNHKKLYQVVETTGTQLTIFPQLRNNVGMGESVIYNNLTITATLDVDQSFDMAIQSVSTIQFNATEYLR